MKALFPSPAVACQLVSHPRHRSFTKRATIVVSFVWMIVAFCTLHSESATETVIPDQPDRGSAADQAEEFNEHSVRLEIHRSQKQLILYDGSTSIKSYPVAVGRAGWETPLGEFRVFQMVKDPNWKHPLTGKIFKAGERGNQLGRYWIGFWTDGKIAFGFHGTPRSRTVGKPASHGCIRMYERDIEELFTQVKIGTPVTVLP